MEPKKLKKLVLKKEVITMLSQQSMNELKGGCTNSVTCGNPGTESLGTCLTCGGTCICLTYDTPDNHCDFPTFNDSCFSACYDKCNEF